MCIFILFLIQILINDSSVYMRSFVADGNVKADHLKQKTDDTDVWLTNGEGFMTQRDPYETHLSAAKESVQVIYCPTSATV